MKCDKCGAEVAEGAKFCTVCGYKMPESFAAVGKTTKIQNGNGKPSWRGGAMFGLVLVSVFISIVGVIVGIVAIAKRGNRAKQGVAILAVSLVFLFVDVIIVASTSSGTSGTTASVLSTEALSKTPTALVVDYHKLYNDYQANAIKADSIYKGKLLQLTGKVDQIDRA
jgi:hypothetical protein